jgi:ribosomal protein L34E
VAPSDDNARCGRCGQAFHCGVRDAVPCACAAVKLTPAALAELRERYAGCLCPPCLAQWAADPPPDESPVSR